MIAMHLARPFGAPQAAVSSLTSSLAAAISSARLESSPHGRSPRAPGEATRPGKCSQYSHIVAAVGKWSLCAFEALSCSQSGSSSCSNSGRNASADPMTQDAATAKGSEPAPCAEPAGALVPVQLSETSPFLAAAVVSPSGGRSAGLAPLLIVADAPCLCPTGCDGSCEAKIFAQTRFGSSSFPADQPQANPSGKRSGLHGEVNARALPPPDECNGSVTPPAAAVLVVLAGRLANAPWLARDVVLAVARPTCDGCRVPGPPAEAPWPTPFAALRMASAWGRVPVTLAAWADDAGTDMDVAFAAWLAANTAASSFLQQARIGASWLDASSRGDRFQVGQAGPGGALALSLASGAAKLGNLSLAQPLLQLFGQRNPGLGQLASRANELLEGLGSASWGRRSEDTFAWATGLRAAGVDIVGVGPQRSAMVPLASGKWAVVFGHQDAGSAKTTACPVALGQGGVAAAEALFAPEQSRPEAGTVLEASSGSKAFVAPVLQACVARSLPSAAGALSQALGFAAGQWVRQVGALPARPHAAIRGWLGAPAPRAFASGASGNASLLAAAASTAASGPPAIVSIDELRLHSVPAWLASVVALALVSACLTSVASDITAQPATVPSVQPSTKSAGRLAASRVECSASVMLGSAAVAGTAGFAAAIVAAVLAITFGEASLVLLGEGLSRPDIPGALLLGGESGVWDWARSGSFLPWWSSSPVPSLFKQVRLATDLPATQSHGWGQTPPSGGVAIAGAILAAVAAAWLVLPALSAGTALKLAGAISPEHGLLSGVTYVGSRAGSLSRCCRSFDGLLAASSAAEETFHPPTRPSGAWRSVAKLLAGYSKPLAPAVHAELSGPKWGTPVPEPPPRGGEPGVVLDYGGAGAGIQDDDGPPGSLFGAAGKALACGPASMLAIAASQAGARLSASAVQGFEAEAAGRVALGVWAPSRASASTLATHVLSVEPAPRPHRSGGRGPTEHEDDAMQAAMASAFLEGLGLSDAGVVSSDGVAESEESEECAEDTGGLESTARVAAAAAGAEPGSELASLFDLPLDHGGVATDAAPNADTLEDDSSTQAPGSEPRQVGAAGGLESAAPRPDPDSTLGFVLPSTMPPAILSGALSDLPSSELRDTSSGDSIVGGSALGTATAAMAHGVVPLAASSPVLCCACWVGAGEGFCRPVGSWLDGTMLSLWQCACSYLDIPVPGLGDGHSGANAWLAEPAAIVRASEREALACGAALVAHSRPATCDLGPSILAMRDRGVAALGTAAVAIVLLVQLPTLWLSVASPMAGVLWAPVLASLAVGCAGAALSTQLAFGSAAATASGCPRPWRQLAAAAAAWMTSLAPIMLGFTVAAIAGLGAADPTQNWVQTLWRGGWLVWTAVTHAVEHAFGAGLLDLERSRHLSDRSAAVQLLFEGGSSSLSTLFFVAIPLAGIWVALVAEAGGALVLSAARLLSGRAWLLNKQ